MSSPQTKTILKNMTSQEKGQMKMIQKKLAVHYKKASDNFFNLPISSIEIYYSQSKRSRYRPQTQNQQIHKIQINSFHQIEPLSPKVETAPNQLRRKSCQCERCGKLSLFEKKINTCYPETQINQIQYAQEVDVIALLKRKKANRNNGSIAKAIQ